MGLAVLRFGPSCRPHSNPVNNGHCRSRLRPGKPFFTVPSRGGGTGSICAPDALNLPNCPTGAVASNRRFPGAFEKSPSNWQAGAERPSLWGRQIGGRRPFPPLCLRRVRIPSPGNGDRHERRPVRNLLWLRRISACPASAPQIRKNELDLPENSGPVPKCRGEPPHVGSNNPQIEALTGADYPAVGLCQSCPRSYLRSWASSPRLLP